MTLQALFEQAVGFHQRGHLAEAEKLYREILRTTPRSFEPRHMLGIIRAQQGRNAEALTLLGEALAMRPDDAAALTNCGNVLAALGRFDEALENHDKALVHAPAYADALNNRGNALRGLGRRDAALESYDRALALQPGHLDALNNRGIALQDLKRFEEAVASHDRVLALAPQHADAHFNRANALLALARHGEALASYDAALALWPQNAGYLNNRGQCLQAMARLDEALASYDRALALAPDFAEAALNKGICLLLAGRYGEGLPLYEWRKKLPAPVEARDYAQPLWTGTQDLHGKTLFLYIEQGLGDTIQFCRYVALTQARGATVILSAQDILLRLLRGAIPTATLIGYTSVPEHFDYHAPLMSLPLAFGTAWNSIPAASPALQAEPERVRHWAGQIGSHGFRVGISWEGNRNAVGGAGRAFPLRALEAIAKIPGLRLISLQKGAATDELVTMPADMHIEILDDFDNGGDAFVDSAAVIASLDLVITMDGTIAHLAGAMGRPVWVALKHVPDWRWGLEQSSSPWYPGMRLFRQEIEGDWANIFTEMQAQLLDMVK